MLHPDADVTVVIVTHNGLEECLDPCIQSLLTARSVRPFNVVVVDGGSTDGTAEWVRQAAARHPGIALLPLPDNPGFAAANNAALRAFPSAAYYVLLNNDTRVTDDWLDRLIDTFGNGQVGLVGPVSNSVPNWQQVALDPGAARPALQAGAAWAERHAGETFPVDMLSFFCVAIRAAVVGRVGLLDEQFGLGGFEDDDFCLRARAAGYQLVCREDVFVYHQGGASFGRIPGEGRDALFKANLARFEAKHETRWRPACHADGLASFLRQAMQRLDATNLARVRESVEARLTQVSRCDVGSAWRDAYVRMHEVFALEAERKDLVERATVAAMERLATANFLRALLRSGAHAVPHYVFGTGRLSDVVLADVPEGSDSLRGFFDNDERKWGLTKRGLPVSAPRLVDGARVLIASVAEEEIEQQLVGLGYARDAIVRLLERPQQPAAARDASPDLTPAPGAQPPTGTPRASRRLLGVDLLNVNFFDWDGHEIFKGGAERYVADLAHLIASRFGVPVRLVQSAKAGFERDYEGIPVIGIPAPERYDFQDLYRAYLERSARETLVIASPADLGCLPSDRTLIGINHGIHWDTPDRRGHQPAGAKRVLEALAVADRCVCVDTNFINWTRTFDGALAQKLVYVPNYYDESAFTAEPKAFDDGEIVVLYPRRLYPPRGFNLLVEAIDVLLDRHPNVRFHLVGQANRKERGIVERIVAARQGRVRWYELGFQEMARAYSASQIVLVPTVNSEGTSLSCIEALASNNAVIASNVGGLPNLIIDGFNGLLIAPTAAELIAAIDSLVRDRGKRVKLAQHGVLSASAFTKARWEARWTEVLGGYLA